RKLPKGLEYTVIGRQLLKSGTSVGANYRAACRARSKAEFFAKICIVVEEADETCYWLELLQESGFNDVELEKVKVEADEIVKIFSSSRKIFQVKNRVMF
ncbi:MAG: four helix bundle protein, partial [Cyclobacteriaceae bacterium]|nr:four helix bundle protein [Cyclobacteriaceae bacterium]